MVFKAALPLRLWYLKKWTRKARLTSTPGCFLVSTLAGSLSVRANNFWTNILTFLLTGRLAHDFCEFGRVLKTVKLRETPGPYVVVAIFKLHFTPQYSSRSARNISPQYNTSSVRGFRIHMQPGRGRYLPPR